MNLKWKNICECDVQDKELLKNFRDKLELWKNCLGSSDIHSIFNQLTTLFWEHTVYRTFNEARRLSEETNDPSTGLQGTIIELIDKNFMKSQAIAIRCLTDRDKKAISLRRLFDDIKNSVSLYTRENYVGYDGISYDEISIDEFRINHKRNNRHAKYDFLSGKDKSNRSRSDTISSTVFTEMEKEIEKDFKIMRDVEIFVNNWVAHTAASWKRSKHVYVLDQTSLKKFDECYQAIIKIGKKIDFLIDEFLLCSVPTPSFDQLKNWDKSVVTTKDVEILRDYWLERDREIKNWSESARLD